MKLMRLTSLATLFTTLGLCSSCGYHQGNDGILTSYQTLSIDPIADDWNGDLTSALVERLAAKCHTQYRSCGGEVILHVKLEDLDEKNIGFRYDHHKDGKIKKSIIPTETRIIALAEVTLIEASTQKTLLGPVQLRTSIEFDHDYYKTRDGVNIFSLGQLNDYDEAYDAAYSPLINALSDKIVEYINEAYRN